MIYKVTLEIEDNYDGGIPVVLELKDEDIIIRQGASDMILFDLETLKKGIEKLEHIRYA